jgi:hypothetical protein
MSSPVRIVVAALVPLLLPLIAGSVACGRRDHAPAGTGAPSAVSAAASSAPSASPSGSTSTVASVSATGLAPVASEGAFLTFKVPIKVKPGATLKVAHQPATIVDGAVEVRGRPGQTIMVTARDEAGHLAVQKISIEADGPVPASIDLSQ